MYRYHYCIHIFYIKDISFLLENFHLNCFLLRAMVNMAFHVDTHRWALSLLNAEALTVKKLIFLALSVQHFFAFSAL